MNYGTAFMKHNSDGSLSAGVSVVSPARASVALTAGTGGAMRPQFPSPQAAGQPLLAVFTSQVDAFPTGCRS